MRPDEAGLGDDVAVKRGMDQEPGPPTSDFNKEIIRETNVTPHGSKKVTLQPVAKIIKWWPNSAFALKKPEFCLFYVILGLPVRTEAFPGCPAKLY